MTTLDLPEHMIDAGEWKDWPRKLDAHLKWGVRRRQMDAFIRSGRLKIYACPDGVNRLDPDVLRELFGEPGVIPTSDRDISNAERQRRQADAAAMSDPTVLMFRQAVGMMGQLHEQLIGQLKLIADPLKVLLDAHSAQAAAQAKRIADLENQLDAAAALRSELESMDQERQIRNRRETASERRRDETLNLLKEELPKLASKWLEGNSLSGFAARAPRDVVQSIVDCGALSEYDAEILRRGAGLGSPGAAPQPNPNTQANGVSSHGHS